MLCVAKHPRIEVSLLIPKEAWPLVVGMIKSLDIDYKKERHITDRVIGEVVKIEGLDGRGDKLADLLRQVDQLENRMNALGGPNYYILLRAKKGAKRIVRKMGEEADTGSQDGAESGPAD